MKRINIWTTVLVILVAAGSIVLLIYIGSKSKNSTSPKFPRDYESNFLNSCHQNGGSSNGCSCSLLYVEQHYTYEQARKLDGIAKNLPPDIQKAFQDCQSK